MIFKWNSNTIKWYQDANEYTRFFKNLADLIAPKLEGYSTLCDIGCGLGLVDIELSSKIQQITCIDINKNAIKALEDNIQNREITNIETRIMDFNDINESWDVMLLSFFASCNIEKLLPHCKQLIVISNKDKGDPFFKKYRTYSKATYDEVEQMLKDKGIEYSLTKTTLEFGQPLVSVEDGKNYLKNFSSNISDDVLNDYLNKNLTKTNNSKYPYYLPKEKPIGIFQIKGRLG